MRRCCQIAGLLALGCGATKGDPDVVREPSPGPPIVDAATPPPESAPEPSDAEPESQPPPAKPEPSQIPAKLTKVDPGSLPGLIQFADARSEEGALWIGQLEGNGGRDVVIFIPPGADNAAPVELVYHFHGTYSENIAPEKPGLPKKAWVGWNRLGQTMDATTKLQSERPYNVALVYPISAGKRLEPDHRGWSNKMYDRMWMKAVPGKPAYKDSFDRLHRDALGVLTTTLGVAESQIDSTVIAEGHSAGGIALRNIAQVGTDLVAEYIFLDASFETWADGCYAAIREQGAKAFVTIVLTDGGIADPFAPHDPWCAKRPLQAAAYRANQAMCDRDPKAKPRGSHAKCETLAEAARLWPTLEAWCAGIEKDDLASTPGVYLHRTKVSHGKQPGHFSGGLGLPADRYN